ncbi:MAG: class 1 fructose-bisphosphatase [bacterium]
MNDEVGIDLGRHISESERAHPEATGELSQLLGQITLAAKIVSRAVNKAGLAGILGTTGEKNIHGEEMAELDVYANNVFKRNLINNAPVCLVASEEEEEPVEVTDPDKRGKYVVSLDPLDGSSNIDYNVSIGTIFGIYRKQSGKVDEPTTEDDILQKGRNLVASGYVIYGSSTMLVYTTGEEINGFTLDNSIGEFLLCHPDIEMPDSGGSYSVNESYFTKWEKPIQESVESFRADSNYTSRYIGSLVADFHRNLLGGGVFLYPNEPDTPGKENGKLRLLYEAAPLAYLIEAAGGRASNGETDILDLSPERLHQRVPLYIGNKDAVDLIEKNVEQHATAV